MDSGVLDLSQLVVHKVLVETFSEFNVVTKVL